MTASSAIDQVCVWVDGAMGGSFNFTALSFSRQALCHNFAVYASQLFRCAWRQPLLTGCMPSVPAEVANVHSKQEVLDYLLRRERQGEGYAALGELQDAYPGVVSDLEVRQAQPS